MKPFELTSYMNKSFSVTVKVVLVYHKLDCEAAFLISSLVDHGTQFELTLHLVCVNHLKTY